MPALDDILAQKLGLLESKHQRRMVHETMLDGVIAMRNGKRLVSFSSNDYLGLSRHPKVIAAAKDAVDRYGAGAGASRLVTGNYPLYTELETRLASYKKTESACVFGSGYLANLGAIPALVGAGDLILMDKFSHACMIEAARLSGATLMRFAHNNVEHCRMLLAANRSEHQHCLIATETIFSMDGDRAPMAKLEALAREFNAWLMTDDAHGLGICHPERAKGESKDLGDNTRSLGFARDEAIHMGTLSKAVGSYGGYVCGSRILCDYLKTAARTLIYSTALPPASVAAAIAAMDIMQQEPEYLKKPLLHARYFTSLLELPEAQSAIVPVILKESQKALAASAFLERAGFLVTPIRPPTVPENTARLRFAFSALHEKKHVEDVAQIIKEQGWLAS